MSIPKEPRQLMINLMYLVLMALLALNISAEIMNAFYDLDESMQKSNALTSQSVKSTKESIQPILKKKPALEKPLNAGISEIQEFVGEFADQVDEYKKALFVVCTKRQELSDDQIASFIPDISKDNLEYYAAADKGGRPLPGKDKDWTTWYMVKQHKADSLESLIQRTRGEMIDIYAKTMRACQKEAKLQKSEIDSKIKSFEDNLTLAIDSSWVSSGKKSWGEYNFYQMPFAACLPKLEKFKSDARAAEAIMVNDLAGLVGGRELKLNKFFPVMNAKRGYVIKGEKFEAEVAIGAFSSEFAKTSSISVNGQRVSLNAEGKGQFSETANSLGKRTLKLTASVTNPLSGEKMSGNSEFEYEVGVRSATVSLTKMNVFYIGVDNPVEVSVAGANSNKVKATCSGGTMTGGKGKYNVRATSPGSASITVSAEGFSQKFDFRVKRIPDPVAQLGKHDSKSMGNGEFKAQGGVAAILKNFDFDAKCNIVGFELTRVAKRADPVSNPNRGPRYDSKSKNLVMQAKPGDIYYYDNVKTKCPGDPAARKINSLVFKIK